MPAKGIMEDRADMLSDVIECPVCGEQFWKTSMDAFDCPILLRMAMKRGRSPMCKCLCGTTFSYWFDENEECFYMKIK